MLKQKYFLADILILSAEKQPIILLWRKIVWLPNGTGSEIEVDHASGNHASNFSYVYDDETGTVVILYDDGYDETLEVVFVNSNVIYLDGDKLVRQ